MEGREERTTMLDAWIGFGRWLTGKVSVFCIGAMVLGACFPSLFSWIKPFNTALFAVVTFQGALGNTIQQVVDVFRDPKKLLCILCWTVVLQPVLVNLVGGFFFADTLEFVTGLTLEYQMPVAVVSVVWTTVYGGNVALALGFLFVSTLLVPFACPLGMKLLVGADVEVDPFSMMQRLLIMVAIPAIIATIVNERSKGWGKKTLQPIVNPLAKVFMFAIIAANATELHQYIFNMDATILGVLLFVVAVSASGFCVGIILGKIVGDSDEDVVTMCIDCGLRNTSTGAVMAQTFFPGGAMLPVMGGIMAQQTLVIVFGIVLEKLGVRHSEQGGDDGVRNAGA
ncbi:MAG: bile acid:sodium symporter family protein [Atopobiaceae bacterium]|nr:bile acid:sodium symporter family protein [Atopobiaceae bacterium]